MDLKQKLDELSELYVQRDTITLEKTRLIDEIMAPVVEKINEINAEFIAPLEAITEKTAALEAEIKAGVIENGASVKGSFINAVYTKGRITWDSKQLDGLMILLPQLATARKEGEPSVSLRRI